MKFKKILAALMSATLISNTALAHTNSIGYVGDGNGGLNFWYGNWHGQAFNEAEIKIIKPDGSTSIDAFNLLSQNSPAGLISGVNFFTSDGTQLVPYDPSGPTGQESYVWQGINYTGLVTGQYTFVYIPLGDAESSDPTGSPTQDWAPMDQVIRSLTINLTQGDLDGDANQNGILDINEVAAGSASGGPTVVSRGSSQVVGYIAVSGGVLQVVQRTQTDTMWDNMSDGSIANQMSHVTQLPDLVGRIDQIATGNQVLSVANRSLSFNDVNAVGSNNKANNGMSGGVAGITFGGTRQLDNGWSIGAGVGKLSTRVRDNGSADVESTLVNLHGGRTLEQGRVDFSLTHAMNDYTSSRTIGDFANSSVTSGSDTWANATFTGNGERIRPVLGVTHGVRSVNGYTESGSIQTARTVADSTEWYTFGTVGAEATIIPGITASALHHTDGVNSLTLGVNKEVKKGTTVRASVSRNVSDLSSSNSVRVGLKILF